MTKTLCIVVPCYNEEEALELSAPILLNKINNLISCGKITEESRILFVDDGSADKTWGVIEALAADNIKYAGLKLSKNVGHQNAIIAGMDYAKDFSDFVVTIDADLQDDVDAIDEMVAKHYEGSEIVYGVRKSRKTDNTFKRTTANIFYRLMMFLGVEIVYNHADFRLMSKRAVEALENFEEVNLFLRGIVPLIGFKASVVEYERKARNAGASKYPLRKMISFALNGITSFSIKPIRMITATGFVGFFLAIAFTIYSIIGYFLDNNVSGWTSTVISIWIFGSLQLMATGVIGEYIGKIYLETKKRPKYFVEKRIKDYEKQDST